MNLSPKYLLYSLLALALSGCYTAHKAAKQLDMAHAKHAIITAGRCAMWYPVRVIDSVRVQYQEGVTEYDTAFVYANCDSVMNLYRVSGGKGAVNTKYVRVPCPPSTHRVDTIITERLRQVENTAKTTIAEKRATDAESKAVRLERGRNTWRIIGLVGLALVVGGAVLKIVRSKLI